MRIHITTALFGGGDSQLILPEQNDIDGFDISISCYTDANTESRENSLHPRMKGKIPKMAEWIFFDADIYIWLDASFRVISDKFIREVYSALNGHDMCLFNHSLRSSIRDEFNLVNGSNDPYIKERYNWRVNGKQVSTYLSDLSFVDNRLLNSAFLLIQ